MTAVLLDRLPHHAFIVHCNGEREPDFGVTSVNYDFAELLSRADPPA